MTVAVGDVLAQSQVSLGDGFMIVSVYSALLGSTLDTSFVSVYGVISYSLRELVYYGS